MISKLLHHQNQYYLVLDSVSVGYYGGGVGPMMRLLSRKELEGYVPPLVDIAEATFLLSEERAVIPLS